MSVYSDDTSALEFFLSFSVKVLTNFSTPLQSLGGSRLFRLEEAVRSMILFLTPEMLSLFLNSLFKSCLSLIVVVIAVVLALVVILAKVVSLAVDLAEVFLATVVVVGW